MCKPYHSVISIMAYKKFELKLILLTNIPVKQFLSYPNSVLKNSFFLFPTRKLYPCQSNGYIHTLLLEGSQRKMTLELTLLWEELSSLQPPLNFKIPPL